MAWNPSPTVAAARDIGKKFGKRKVIVFMFDDDTLEYASYGETAKLCKEAERNADVMFGAMMRALEKAQGK